MQIFSYIKLESVYHIVSSNDFCKEHFRNRTEKMVFTGHLPPQLKEFAEQELSFLQTIV